jgi:hypothetical protein
MDLIVAMEKLVGFVKQILAALTATAMGILTIVILTTHSAMNVSIPVRCAFVIAEHSYVNKKIVIKILY